MGLYFVISAKKLDFSTPVWACCMLILHATASDSTQRSFVALMFVVQWSQQVSQEKKEKKEKKKLCVHNHVELCVLLAFGTVAFIFIYHFQTILIKIGWAWYASQLDFHSFSLQMKDHQLTFSNVCHTGRHESIWLCLKIVNLTKIFNCGHIPCLGGDSHMFLM